MVRLKIKLFLTLKSKSYKMKRILFFLCLLAGFAACNSKTDQGSPAASIDAMFTAMKSGSIDDVKKFITKQDVAFLESAEKFANSINPEAIQSMKTKMSEEFKAKVKDIKYVLKNEKIDGDKATVDAEVTDQGKVETHTFNLLKEDGAWKISLINSGDGMFNSMKGNMGPDIHDVEEGLEKLKKMNPDSLKAMLDSLKNKMGRH